jgi:methylmalonyl-CoA epimerase
MFQGIDHIVIAVKDLDAAVAQYEKIYGMPVSERMEAPQAGMKMAFFRFGDEVVELVTATSDQGPIAKRLATTGEGVHLLCMRVDDVNQSVADLRDRGVRLVGDPGPGNPVTGQVFIHPSETGGVLTELRQPR